jgi:phosphonopyruvate decarboxylase
MSGAVSSAGFVNACTACALGPWLGVPCSFLRPFINYVIDRPDLDYLPATNEGEALAIAAGSWFAGRTPVVMLQNSGLGNLVNPLASLNFPFRIPALLIVTLRGEPGRPDEPQHELMGRISGTLLDALEVRHEPFPTHDADVPAAVARAAEHMATTGRPFAFLLRKGTVSDDERPATRVDTADRPSRREALGAIRDAIPDNAVVVATTGKTGREWFELGDRPRNLYVVGSMGCAPSIALGIARERSDPVVVIDGDGAALMRLEAWASIGHHGPARLLHVLLDNEAYDSTGAQRTISGSMDFPAIARGMGYRSATTVPDASALGAAVREAFATPGPHLVHCRISLGASADLGRPSVAPREVAQRLRATLTGSLRIDA